MQSIDELIKTGATVLGVLIAFIGLIQSRTWLAGIGTVCLGASIAAGTYAWSQRLIVKSAGIKIEGQSIDSLNIANLRRRVNTSLVIQEARHTAIIEGENLKMIWRYSGFCKAKREASIQFSIDSDNQVPFNQLDCVAYDLMHDPGRKHKIYPILIGTDGISKKLAVPFLEPLAAQEPFEVLLKCALPGCMAGDVAYYTSTLSFHQDRVGRYAASLIFLGARPEWMRAYEPTASGDARLLKDLKPMRQDRGLTQYMDIAQGVEGQAARIYVFARGSAQKNERTEPACSDTGCVRAV